MDRKTYQYLADNCADRRRLRDGQRLRSLIVGQIAGLHRVRLLADHCARQARHYEEVHNGGGAPRAAGCGPHLADKEAPTCPSLDPSLNCSFVYISSTWPDLAFFHWQPALSTCSRTTTHIYHSPTSARTLCSARGFRVFALACNQLCSTFVCYEQITDCPARSQNGRSARGFR